MKVRSSMTWKITSEIAPAISFKVLTQFITKMDASGFDLGKLSLGDAMMFEKMWPVFARLVHKMDDSLYVEMKL